MKEASLIAATFDVPTLADAVSKASRVTPTKGTILDKCAGITIELNQDTPDDPVLVKATDGVSTFRQRIPSATFKGDERRKVWRISAPLITGVLSKLPAGPGSTVTLGDTGDGFVRLVCNKTKAKFHVLGGVPQPVERFDSSAMVEATALASRVSQVAWATKRGGSDPLAGVRITGDHLLACDSVSAARVPCKVDLTAPVTASLFVLAPLIKPYPDLHLRATDKRLLIEVDEDTQITTALIDGTYPDVDRFLDAPFLGGTFGVHRPLLADVIQRALVLHRGERDIPMCRLVLNGDVLDVTLEVAEVGSITDQIEVVGDGSSIDLWLTPATVLNAMSGCAGDDIQISHQGDPLKPIRFQDDFGYTAITMPRKVTS